MNHLTMFLSCVFSVEIFLRLNFLSILDSIYVISNKALHLVTKKNISDHWKEKFIPAYSIKIIKSSLRVILILLLIFLMLAITEFFLHNFIDFVISYLGLIESIFFAFGYFYFRKMAVR